MELPGCRILSPAIMCVCLCARTRVISCACRRVSDGWRSRVVELTRLTHDEMTSHAPGDTLLQGWSVHHVLSGSIPDRTFPGPRTDYWMGTV